jgi:hypothetical protein
MSNRPLVLVSPIVGVFVAGVVVVNAGRLYVRVAWLLGLFQLVPLTAALFVERTALTYLVAIVTFLLVTILLILFSTYCVLSYVLRAETITTDQVYAGICLYLMLGFAFGGIYHLFNALNPSSFAVGGVPAVPGQRPDLIYFSFVTLATLGYGDITPLSHFARSLSELEAVAGTLYIAIFMARLVSKHSEGSSREPGE